MNWRLKAASVCALVCALFSSTPCVAGGPPPVILVQPLNISVLNLGTATFTVVALSGTTMTYQWLKDGTNIDGATLSILTIVNVGLGDRGSYSVRITNAGGTVTSSAVALDVLAPPAISAQPASLTVAKTQAASFSVAADGSGALSYQWLFNGSAISGATSSTLALAHAESSNQGGYSVTVSSSLGSVTSSVATLTVTNPVINLSASGAGAGLTPAGFTFQFAAPAGITYVILASTDNQVWTPVVTNVTLSATTGFTDTNAASHAQRFYRVMVP